MLFAAPVYSAADANTGESATVKQCLAANTPAGTPRSIFPGRVAWSHAPGAASWDMGDSRWFYDSCNSQDDCDWMTCRTLLTLSGADNAADAWDKVLRYFNSTRGKGAEGHKSGETIAIKINNNNTDSHADSDEINASPQMVYALLKSLTEDGGVAQEE